MGDDPVLGVRMALALHKRPLRRLVGRIVMKLMPLPPDAEGAWGGRHRLDRLTVRCTPPVVGSVSGNSRRDRALRG
jgi:hypothetical protein